MVLSSHRTKLYNVYVIYYNYIALLSLMCHRNIKFNCFILGKPEFRINVSTKVITASILCCRKIENVCSLSEFYEVFYGNKQNALITG